MPTVIPSRCPQNHPCPLVNLCPAGATPRSSGLERLEQASAAKGRLVVGGHLHELDGGDGLDHIARRLVDV
jgi:hypothetical protein